MRMELQKRSNEDDNGIILKEGRCYGGHVHLKQDFFFSIQEKIYCFQSSKYVLNYVSASLISLILLTFKLYR